VVVVGAGCIGASTAVHLVLAGVRNVVLIEKGAPASMTTGWSSAIVRQHYSQPTFARWAAESLVVWRRFSDVFGVAPVFTATGWAIAGSAADAEPMRQCVVLLRGLGVETELLSREDLAALDPSVHVEDFACAAYEPDAGYCDPRAAAAGFAEAFERHGGRARFGVRVTGLRRDGDAWALQTAAGTIRSPRIVNAAGAYARWLAALAGVEVPIEHYAHDISVFGSVGGRIALYDLVRSAYYRPNGSAETLVGSMNWSEGARVLDDPDAFPWVANPQVAARHGRALAWRYPGAEPGLVRGHAGIYFITPDRYPILGEAPEAPGLFLACGFSHGFKVSPAVGEAIATRLTQGTQAAPELDEFRPTRFADGQPIKPLYPYPSGIQT
jgi:glycine/D-amino acid oxidase-like deaminating enzyme